MKLLTLLLLALMVQSGQQSHPAASGKAAPVQSVPQHQASDGNRAAPETPRPDEGSISGKTYTSDFFTFTYTLPEHLEPDENFMAEQEDAAALTVILLAAYGPSPDGGRREGVVLSADRFTKPGRSGPGWASGYLQDVSRLLVAQGAEPAGAVREYSLGGQKFFRADFTRGGPQPGVQTLMVTRRRGYVLGFDFAAPSAARIDKLIESLKSIRFAAAVPAKPAK